MRRELKGSTWGVGWNGTGYLYEVLGPQSQFLKIIVGLITAFVFTTDLINNTHHETGMHFQIHDTQDTRHNKLSNIGIER